MDTNLVQNVEICGQFSSINLVKLRIIACTMSDLPIILTACCSHMCLLRACLLHITDMATSAASAACTSADWAVSESFSSAADAIRTEFDGHLDYNLIFTIIEHIQYYGDLNGSTFKANAILAVQTLMNHELHINKQQAVFTDHLHRLQHELEHDLLRSFCGGPIEEKYKGKAAKWQRNFLFSKDFVYVVAKHCHKYFIISRRLMQSVCSGNISLSDALRQSIDNPRCQPQVRMTSVDRILLCLWQLRNNVKYSVLSDAFGLSESVRHAMKSGIA